MSMELGIPDIVISGNADDDVFIFIENYEDYCLAEIGAEFAKEKLGLTEPSDTKTTFYKLGSDCTEEDILVGDEADKEWRTEVDQTTFENSEYKVVVVNRETYVGASLGYEQILLSVLNGAVAGTVSYFVDKTLKEYGLKKTTSSENERKALIFSFLEVRYGANRNLIVIDTKKKTDEWYYKVEDIGKSIVFELFLNDFKGVRVIRIKK